MKHFFALSSLLFSFLGLYAQPNYAGNYQSNGYFFHPSSSRSLYSSNTKYVMQVGPSTYQTTLADLPAYTIQFDVDTNNNIVNFQVIGVQPGIQPVMLLQNDSSFGITYPTSLQPGQYPYLHSIYGNFYDPNSKKFYFHYGYLGSSGYRIIYEDLTFAFFVLPPRITSFTPKAGTSGTPITIRGSGFAKGIDPYGVTFGGVVADSISIVSDSLLIAWVGYGQSGNLKVSSANGYDTLPGFVFQPLPTITNPGWYKVGNIGRIYGADLCTAIGSDDVIYISYIESFNSGISKVIKYSNGVWANVGAPPSKGLSANTKLVLDNANNPIVGFSDSTNGGLYTVKKFDGINWNLLGKFSPLNLPDVVNGREYCFSLDNADNPYMFDGRTVYKLSGGIWTTVGNSNFIKPYFFSTMTIDKGNNTIYVAYDSLDNAGIRQAVVKKFDGNKWVYVGQPFFTSTSVGVFYLILAVDNTGKLFLSFQDDNGFERLSVYQFENGVWGPLGSPRFTQTRSYSPSFLIDKANRPFLFFQQYGGLTEFSSAMNYSKGSGWNYVGAKGAIKQANYYNSQAVAFDTKNYPVIAINDTSTMLFRINVISTNPDLLPLDLISLSVRNTEQAVSLDWQTANETNTANFLVQRSTDGVSFKTINSVAARGNDNAIATYRYLDAEVANLQADKINYRLQMIDKDGSTSYSKVVTVQLTTNHLPLITISPNPARATVVVTLFASPKARMVGYRLITPEGKPALSGTAALPAGKNSFRLNLSAVPKGSYRLVVEGNGEKQLIVE